ncbi:MULTISPECIES: oligopeptide transporter, OPT family [Anaerococcus]|uniref:Oligopeptide transporter, OPT family n=1 Tax=Anaerococcus octavius TaxID=54007 RepID=A0A380WUP4_9FIRM|nr:MULTISPECIES: oligopeptide transporter, OPT family [Anaerococcus]MBS6106343.1 oligopeptide transporter, OPT family [Anaerococcus sp.]MDU3177000.1 oligopeptide transporter, OPT family [Anaerococcus sp.]SUU91922.1 oligopeptide transporter, OPT family [Anaerococcus octavius]
MEKKPEKNELREFTPLAIILGVIIAIVFGAANAYLGLRVGLTISASIPAAVISMGIVRKILKRDSILENNLVQTIGSAGESLAAGAIFTLPAAFLWETEWGDSHYISYLNILLLTLIGGILGVIFMIPLRRALIVKEDGVLPYPEGKACAEVLKAGEEGGQDSSVVFKGLGLAALYKFLANGLKIFPEEVSYEISAKNFAGTAVGFDALPALMGVGYIVGPNISAIMLSGGILAWFVLMPLLHAFGSTELTNLAPSDLWSNYIRYIGAGAVATGGIISLVKSLPMIVKSFKDSISDLKSRDDNSNSDRLDTDISFKASIILIIISVILIFLMPSTPVNIVGAIIIVIFGFFFATVSSRMVGIIGSSNNPVSGMSIATLLIATLILKATGLVGHDGMIAAISIGTIICVIAAIAGDCSQDLKTGYIVGASPKYQQIGEIIGVLASALAIGGILWILNTSIGFGTKDLPAPQAVLMKMIVEGVMNGNLPWDLVFIGAAIAIMIELLGISVLPFAIGLYLPLNTSLGIMFGGVVRLIVDKLKIDKKSKKDAETKGTLYSAGLIAGEGIMGIILAIFAIIPSHGKTLADAINISDKFSLPQEVSIVLFLGLAVLIYSKAKSVIKKEKVNA